MRDQVGVEISIGGWLVSVLHMLGIGCLAYICLDDLPYTRTRGNDDFGIRNNGFLWRYVFTGGLGWSRLC
jgi:hypothetical protein